MDIYDAKGNLIKPNLPPPGPEVWIEKGFPRYDKPNRRQKILNKVFGSTV